MTTNRIQYCMLAFLVSISVILFNCSLNDSMAGGTGVGNPGNTIVSIIADTGFVITDYNRETSVSSGNILPQQIPIMDMDSLTFLASSILITVERTYFVLDNKENGYDLLAGLDETPFTCDKEHIILDGPFIFDALTGLSTPSFDSIQLPEAKYTGIKLRILDNSNLEGHAIEVAGTFLYKDVTRTFSIRMEEDLLALFKYKGPAFQITKGDSTNFLLVLNADQWLQYMSVKNYLDNDLIVLDQNGNLTVDKTTNTDPYKEFKKAFKSNIIKSGILIIVPLK